MSRRSWTVEEKLSVVLEMVKGQESITSLCHRHGVAMSQDRKSTRLNSSHSDRSRMPSSA